MPSSVSYALLALLVTGTVLPLFRHPSYWVRGWDFPRVQLLILAAVLVLLELLASDQGMESRVRAGIAAACFIYHLVWILPYTPIANVEVKKVGRGAAGPRLRILAFNVLTPNRKASEFVELVKRVRPDVVVTVETDQWWESQLAALHHEYPHRVACPLDNLYGMHLLSRHPLEDCRIQFLVEDDKPSIHTLIVLPDSQRLELHCLHPAPPSPTENETSSERDAELVMVGKAVKNSPYPVIVTGDLNDVAWSATTRLFRKVSGLLDPRIGRGLYNTFHAKYPCFRWPVDHVFVSKHFTLAELRTLPNCGSDHFPVLIELALNDPSSAEQREEGLKPDRDDQIEAVEKVAAEGVSPSDVHRPGRQRRAAGPVQGS
jgi:endonuclease/exonuclease/phosphatase (EEP) superfamily protein YafD